VLRSVDLPEAATPARVDPHMARPVSPRGDRPSVPS
jgi:hypothetical protein